MGYNIPIVQLFLKYDIFSYLKQYIRMDDGVLIESSEDLTVENCIRGIGEFC